MGTIEVEGIFPFGRHVLPRRPSAASPRRVFILGAYPSALHVRWQPPRPYRIVAALAVDNEPEPFWTADDEEQQIERWRDEVGFSSAWGSVSRAGRLNGSSGRWLRDNVLVPLGLGRHETWITDCLDTYRGSDDQHGRLGNTYAPVAEAAGLPPASLPPHPRHEDAIVNEAAERHQVRLRDELRGAAPEQLITLGRAALRVLLGLVQVEDDEVTPALDVDPDGNGAYGQAVRVRVVGHEATWLCLAHPGAAPRYQLAHQRWLASR
jgi:uracil-DNA glycosylase